MNKDIKDFHYKPLLSYNQQKEIKVKMTLEEKIGFLIATGLFISLVCYNSCSGHKAETINPIPTYVQTNYHRGFYGR